VQGAIVKQKAHISNATNAINRSDLDWIKELGIDDQGLISSLRQNIEVRLKGYEKELAGFQDQVSELQSELTELDENLAEFVDQPVMVDDKSKFTNDDSFYAVINEAKVVAHLVSFHLSWQDQDC
jgi:hypothetical protein